ncbi:MAG: PRC-barrel domain-containing protein [Pseudomonadota bacterium]
MSYLDRDTYGMYKNYDTATSEPRLMGADTLIGDDVYNQYEEDLGDIKEIMIDVRTGRISYAVLSFGGFLGLGEKLFAVPWNALKLDYENKRFVLNIEKERLENAPGFDKDNWPNMADKTWENEIHNYYGTKPFADETYDNVTAAATSNIPQGAGVATAANRSTLI